MYQLWTFSNTTNLKVEDKLTEAIRKLITAIGFTSVILVLWLGYISYVVTQIRKDIDYIKVEAIESKVERSLRKTIKADVLNPFRDHEKTD